MTMTRTRSHSLAEGGLNWDSLPLKLFAGGNAKFWNPADIDFSRDRADWEALIRSASATGPPGCARSSSRARKRSPRTSSRSWRRWRPKGRFGDEMYLTQFASRRPSTPRSSGCGSTPSGSPTTCTSTSRSAALPADLLRGAAGSPSTHLPTDPSPATQVRASVTYNHVIEGMTGPDRILCVAQGFAWTAAFCPACRNWCKRIGDDERRHMAWGTFTCRRHVAADDANWGVFEARMNELMPLALRNTDGGFRPLRRRVPFNLTMDEFMQYAADKGMRRFGTISSARGRPLADIDLDYSPLQLEDTFADEDEKALAASA